MKRLLSTLALTLCPIAALADCPTGENLNNGIRFQVIGGDNEVFRTHGTPGVVEAFYNASDGYTTRTLLGQGVYLLEVLDFENNEPVPDSRSTYGFPTTPAEMPLPKPFGGWAVKVGTLNSDGPGSEVQSYSFGDMTEYSFGACTYQMIPVHIRYEDDEAVDVLHYLPQLGLSYLAEVRSVDGTDVYSYYQIEAVQ